MELTIEKFHIGAHKVYRLGEFLTESVGASVAIPVPSALQGLREPLGSAQDQATFQDPFANGVSGYVRWFFHMLARI